MLAFCYNCRDRNQSVDAKLQTFYHCSAALQVLAKVVSKMSTHIQRHGTRPQVYTIHHISAYHFGIVHIEMMKNKIFLKEYLFSLFFQSQRTHFISLLSNFSCAKLNTEC